MGINFFTIEKQTIGCRSIYTVKFLPNGLIECLKPWLIVKGYIQTYGIGYFDTFSLASCLHYFRVLLFDDEDFFIS